MTRSFEGWGRSARWFTLTCAVAAVGCGSDAAPAGSASSSASSAASSSQKPTASAKANASATASATGPSGSAVAMTSASSSANAAAPGGAWALFDLPAPSVDRGDLFTGSYKETVLVPKGWKQAKGGGADTIYREDRGAFFVFYNINAAKLDDKKLETILAFAPLKASKVETKDTADDHPVGKDAIHCRVGHATATLDGAPATVTWAEYVTVMRGDAHAATDHLVWAAVEKDGSPDAATNELHAIFASLTKPKESCGSGSLCP